MTNMYCICHSCIRKNNIKDKNGLPYELNHMILCPKCGNKRCPKASNHELECTNSNNPGQPGSIYEKQNY